MTHRPPFLAQSNRFPSFPYNDIRPPENVKSPHMPSNNGFQIRLQNNMPNCNYMNSPNINPSPSVVQNSHIPTMSNNVANNVHFGAIVPRQQSVNVTPFSSPFLTSPRPCNFLNSNVRPPNVNAPDNRCYSNQSTERFPNTNAGVPLYNNNSNFNVNSRNIQNEPFPYPTQNTTFNNLPPNNLIYQVYQNSCLSDPRNIMPQNLPRLPQVSATMSEKINNFQTSPVNYSTLRAGIMNTSVPQPVIYTNPLTIAPILTNSPQVTSSSVQHYYTGQMPPQILQNDAPELQVLNTTSYSVTCDKEIKLTEFLGKFSINKQKSTHKITVPEFRYTLKAAIHMIKLLNDKKSKLSNLLDANENEWKSEIESIFNVKKELSTFCSFISAPDNLDNMLKKLRLIRKKRESKKKTKLNKLLEKVKADQMRKERDQEIDKWLDGIKEKNQKLKKEAEMKKEADFILLEVRRKIHEAHRTIEKIKVFEKLRSVRQDNSVKKGLRILPEHSEKFEKKIVILKETMLKQLADYEAEERALKVMLETEQEGQREEEAQWKIKKMQTLQRKKQNHVVECLFGVSDDPLPTDPLYLFHKYHNFANSSIENLIQIRHQWDIYLAEDGEAIPRQWIVPVAANTASWEQCLITSKS